MHKEIDHHKNDQLNKQKEGKGHWKGELASQSEAAVSASVLLLFRFYRTVMAALGWKCDLCYAFWLMSRRNSSKRIRMD